ncbi:MAG TPA: response regulator [Anaerolineae bacterium]|nr:response regulator [Anaerolineae bacterium]
MKQALQPLGYELETAVNGEDALQQLEAGDFGLILLDLRLPGLSGLEVLRRVAEIRPDIRVILISAHGTVENAVEAMRLGAVDFIQKPFVPKELRDIVTRVLDRGKLIAAQASDYEGHLELTKYCINDRHFEAAAEHARRAIGADPTRPEAFNLLGVLFELAGNHEAAMKQYRVAIDLDPTYRPAWQNLNRPGLSVKKKTAPI